MVKIINGKRYNTETAEEIAIWRNGYGMGDFKFCYETLYKTAKGAFFIHGEGGAMSKYSQPCGNATGGGEVITPMSEKEVISWLEDTDNDDVLCEHFPDYVEDA